VQLSLQIPPVDLSAQQLMPASQSLSEKNPLLLLLCDTPFASFFNALAFIYAQLKAVQTAQRRSSER
jgi:hypothetical protein